MNERTSTWSFPPERTLPEGKNLVIFAIIPPVPKTRPPAQYALVRSTNGYGEERRWTCGGVQNAPLDSMPSFLNQPFLGVRQLFRGVIPPFWGPLCVGTSTMCQTCQELGGNNTRDFSQGRLQHMVYYSFWFSTDVTKDSSLEWLLLKYQGDLQVRGRGDLQVWGTRSVF